MMRVQSKANQDRVTVHPGTVHSWMPTGDDYERWSTSRVPRLLQKRAKSPGHSGSKLSSIPRPCLHQKER